MAISTYKYCTELEKRVRNNGKLPIITQTNRNSLPFLDTPLSQPSRNNVTPLIQLPVSQASLLAAGDDCRSITVRGDNFCEVLRDCVREKRWLGEVR